MLFISFSTWDFIKFILTWPFLFIYNSIKVAIYYKKDTKIFNELEDLTEEVKYFAEFIGKGPTNLERYKITNVRFQEHIDLRYISPNHDEQRVIYFMLKRDEDEILLGMGGNGGAGGRYYDKYNIDYENVVKKMYREVERSYPYKKYDKNDKYGINYSKNFSEWKENIIVPILEKYGLSDEDFYYLRRAYIVMSHDKSHPRSIKAKKELLEFFGEEDRAMSFVKEIEDEYVGKVVLDALSKE